MSDLTSDPCDAAVMNTLMARRALDTGDATTALALVDQLPASQQPDLLAEIWLLAGSHTALRPLLPRLSPALRERAQAFLADPPRRPLPIPPAGAADPYAALGATADTLAAHGRAAELAMTHLALSELAPRSDWRAVHIEHAASLAMGLGDPRIAALVRAFEAERDLLFGEHDDAREAADAALAAANDADEPRARERAERVLRALES